MSQLPLDELTTELTPDQVKASLYSIANSVGLKTTAWQKLSPLRTIFAVLAQLFSGFTRNQAIVNRSGFLDFAEGALLTLLAWFVYGVLRNPASKALGEVTIDNAGGGLYTFGPGDLLVLSSTTKKTYENTADVTINPLETGVIVPIRAVEAGSASSADPGDINDFAAASPQLSVTNAAALVGQDEDLDPALRARCRAKLGSLSPNGPRLAIEYVALTRTAGPDGAPLNGDVDCTRVLVLPALGNATIRVVVAGPDGPVTGTTGDPTSPLGKLYVALNRWAIPTGYTLILSDAIAKHIQPDATLYVAASAQLTDLVAGARAYEAIRAYVRTIPIGGIDVGGGGAVLFRALEAAAAKAEGLVEVKLDTEADIALVETEVAVLDVPDLTVVQVAGV